MKNKFLYISKTKSYTNILVLLVFFISYIISQYYVNGDQISYTKVYNELKNYDLVSGFIYYHSQLSSKEFVHFFIIWICSRFVEKNLLFSLVNAVFAFFTIKLLQKWKVSYLVITMLVLSNYYFFAFYFSAERLKIGFLFFIVSLLYKESITKKYIFACLAIMSHVQILLFYFSILFMKIFSYKNLIRLSLKNTLVFSGTLCVIFLLSTQMITKFQIYYNQSNINLFDTIKIVVLLFGALYYSTNRKSTVFLFIPVILAISLLGGERIIFVAYFMFLYFALRVNNGLNLGILITTVYFLIKSIDFLINVFERGNGF